MRCRALLFASLTGLRCRALLFASLTNLRCRALLLPAVAILALRRVAWPLPEGANSPGDETDRSSKEKNEIIGPAESIPSKIVITGPESTGKTTLAGQLARRYAAVGVQEYARHYLHRRSGAYAQGDLLTIARGQLRWERAAREIAAGAFFCDTSLEVIEVWSRWKYGMIEPGLQRLVRAHTADFYLLCAPDLKWQPDPLRENPDDREELFEFYQTLLRGRSLAYGIVRGGGEERLICALQLLQRAGLPVPRAGR